MNSSKKTSASTPIRPSPTPSELVSEYWRPASELHEFPTHSEVRIYSQSEDSGDCLVWRCPSEMGESLQDIIWRLAVQRNVSEAIDKAAALGFDVQRYNAKQMKTQAMLTRLIATLNEQTDLYVNHITNGLVR